MPNNTEPRYKRYKYCARCCSWVPRSAEACPNCGYRQLRANVRFSPSRKRKAKRRQYTLAAARRLLNDLLAKGCSLEEALELVEAVTGYRLSEKEVGVRAVAVSATPP
jgi:predicted amidophosphoribosyltransferase